MVQCVDPHAPPLRGLLPPEGALRLQPGKAEHVVAPTLPTACGSLPPAGALRLQPGEAEHVVAPTLPTACGSLPPAGALRLQPGEAGSAAPAGGELVPQCLVQIAALPGPDQVGSVAPLVSRAFLTLWRVFISAKNVFFA